MIDQIIQAVQQDMMGVLSETQMRQLLDSLNRHLAVIGCVETGDVLERSSDRAANCLWSSRGGTITCKLLSSFMLMFF